MNELVIRIGGDERIMVEETENGVKQVKFILMEDLMRCISRSVELKISSGLLPNGCISYSENASGGKYVAMLYQGEKADISYYQTEYPDFPLPRLVFGFHIAENGRICSVKLGIVENSALLKPSTQMYRYPFSNVSEGSGHLCVGVNTMPMKWQRPADSGPWIAVTEKRCISSMIYRKASVRIVPTDAFYTLS